MLVVLRGYWDRSSAARAFPRDPLNVALRDADISKLEVVQAVQLTKTFIVSIAFAGTIDHASRQRCCERDDDRADSVNGRRCLFTSLFGRLHRSRLLLRRREVRIMAADARHLVARFLFADTLR